MDGYAGYNRVLDLRDNAPIQLAYCWALTHHNVAPIAEEGLKQIADLYRIESRARGTSAEDRLALRQAKSAAKVATFKTWLDQTGLQVSAKSPMPSRAQSATSRCNAKTHSSRVMTQAPRTERCSRH